MPALQQWRCTREQAQQISQPVLAVLGADSGALFREGHELVREWFPQAEGFILPGATHALQMQNPRPLAEALAGFLARHPLPVPA
jgi:pimeloyl-ACP methyl ester carboxylesterase